MAHVNEIELVLWVSPASLVLDIVDDEGHIFWHPVGLYGRQIQPVKVRSLKSIRYYGNVSL